MPEAKESYREGPQQGTMLYPRELGSSQEHLERSLGLDKLQYQLKAPQRLTIPHKPRLQILEAPLLVSIFALCAINVTTEESISCTMETRQVAFSTSNLLTV